MAKLHQFFYFCGKITSKNNLGADVQRFGNFQGAFAPLPSPHVAFWRTYNSTLFVTWSEKDGIYHLI